MWMPCWRFVFCFGSGKGFPLFLKLVMLRDGTASAPSGPHWCHTLWDPELDTCGCQCQLMFLPRLLPLSFCTLALRLDSPSCGSDCCKSVPTVPSNFSLSSFFYSLWSLPLCAEIASHMACVFHRRWDSFPKWCQVHLGFQGAGSSKQPEDLESDVLRLLINGLTKNTSILVTLKSLKSHFTLSLHFLH